MGAGPANNIGLDDAGLDAAIRGADTDGPEAIMGGAEIIGLGRSVRGLDACLTSVTDDDLAISTTDDCRGTCTHLTWGACCTGEPALCLGLSTGVATDPTRRTSTVPALDVHVGEPTRTAVRIWHG